MVYIVQPIHTIIFFTYYIYYCVGRLQLVQILFRHGERAPTSYLRFPTEPSNTTAKFDVEKGELTNVGIRQEYYLGLRLREQYGSFIGAKYTPSKVNMLAGGDNRTITSGLAVLAALFPPNDDQIWNERLLWQPVAVHSEELIDYVSDIVIDKCPAKGKEMKESEAYQRTSMADQSFKQWLSNATGIDVSDAYEYQRVIDSLYTRYTLEDLALPEWAQGENFHQMLAAKRAELHSAFVEMTLPESGGWIYDQIVANIDRFISNNTKHNIVLYSGHDTNIMTLGKYLEIKQLDVLTDYGGSLAIELHSENGAEIIKIWFSPAYNASFIPVDIPGCAPPCAHEIFGNLKPRVSSESWMSTCVGSSLSSVCETYTVTVGSLVVTIFVLLLAIIGLLVSTCHFWKLSRLRDPEQIRLLS
ncbi:hypothetical protein AB6A40_002125 [Gnathostoma spinigerum]|uniref:Acid phosphatase n=1 Tax=Gnathostoma spinigerum TaxID=75299 RepID=A0ABD6EDF9_9BILA